MTAAAIVLAAGSATRFGATKQLAEVAGRPLVAHAVDAALAGGLDTVVVVVGHDAGRVARAVPADPRVSCVHNPAHGAGMSTSLRTGVDALGHDVDVAVVLLADQPGIDPGVVTGVVAAVRDGATAARAAYRDGPGHPVAFARSVFPRLRTVRGDRGARDVLDDVDVVAVPVDTDAPPDVDTPAELSGR